MVKSYKQKGSNSFFAGYKWRLLATTIEFAIYNLSKDLYTKMLQTKSK